jgi:hypothetical protein
LAVAPPPPPPLVVLAGSSLATCAFVTKIEQTIGLGQADEMLELSFRSAAAHSVVRPAVAAAREVVDLTSASSPELRAHATPSSSDSACAAGVEALVLPTASTQAAVEAITQGLAAAPWNTKVSTEASQPMAASPQVAASQPRFVPPPLFAAVKQTFASAAGRVLPPPPPPPPPPPFTITGQASRSQQRPHSMMGAIPPPPPPPNFKICVGGLGDIDDGLIRRLLDMCGTLQSPCISWDRSRSSGGQLRGFGMCYYRGPSGAACAMRVLKGAQVRINVTIKMQVSKDQANHLRLYERNLAAATDMNREVQERYRSLRQAIPKVVSQWKSGSIPAPANVEMKARMLYSVKRSDFPPGKAGKKAWKKARKMSIAVPREKNRDSKIITKRQAATKHEAQSAEDIGWCLARSLMRVAGVDGRISKSILCGAFYKDYPEYKHRMQGKLNKAKIFGSSAHIMVHCPPVWYSLSAMAKSKLGTMDTATTCQDHRPTATTCPGPPAQAQVDSRGSLTTECVMELEDRAAALEAQADFLKQLPLESEDVPEQSAGSTTCTTRHSEVAVEFKHSVGIPAKCTKLTCDMCDSECSTEFWRRVSSAGSTLGPCGARLNICPSCYVVKQAGDEDDRAIVCGAARYVDGIIVAALTSSSSSPVTANGQRDNGSGTAASRSAAEAEAEDYKLALQLQEEEDREFAREMEDVDDNSTSSDDDTGPTLRSNRSLTVSYDPAEEAGRRQLGSSAVLEVEVAQTDAKSQSPVAEPVQQAPVIDFGGPETTLEQKWLPFVTKCAIGAGRNPNNLKSCE